MKVGANYLFPISASGVNISLIDSVVFTFTGKSKVTKKYPDNVNYDGENFNVALTQEDTIALGDGAKLQTVKFECQFNYSDKFGYLWKETFIGNVSVAKEYVVDAQAKGTMDNPYTDDSILVDNAYYIIDGVKYVYMSGQLVEFDW